MDTLGGNHGVHDAGSASGYGLPGGDAPDDSDVVDNTPPPVIGADERRMQVRAYNFWAGLLEDRNYPSIDRLDPRQLPDFGPNSVLLNFADGVSDPHISFIGDALIAECAPDGNVPRQLSQVQSRSLLSRITDHYMQILANQSPIGFEAEFVNHAGVTILYRGILLPFSSDDEAIDFIFGVINWKAIADARSTQELLLEIDEALEQGVDQAKKPSTRQDMTDWADGPASLLADTDMPASDAEAGAAMGSADAGGAKGDRDTPDSEPQALGDWLALARDTARQAQSSEERTHAALYNAVSRAWDFALAAAQEPQGFAKMLEEAGITMQDRAPMTPAVKLVFGADYDKTRLTEYAAVLRYAQRNKVACGELSHLLQSADGGLKGIVAEERAMRRARKGTSADSADSTPGKAIAEKLRALPPRALTELGATDAEFALLMARRNSAGDIEIVGEVPDEGALLEQAARRLID